MIESRWDEISANRMALPAELTVPTLVKLLN